MAIFPSPLFFQGNNFLYKPKTVLNGQNNNKLPYCLTKMEHKKGYPDEF